MLEPKQRTWRILHIDDDEDDYILTRSMLNQAHGRSVQLDWAFSLEMGRKLLLDNQYDAVLVDYDLGTGTGVELISEFVHRGYTAPLILFTGRGSYEIDVEAMRAGATIYIPKGEVNPLSLERSIRYAIERKQAEEAQRSSEHKLRIALDAAQLGTWVYNYEDDSLEMDERAQRLYRAKSPVINHENLVRNYLHPDDVQPMRTQLKAISTPQGNGHYQIEYRILQADGSYCWINAWGQVQFEGEGDLRRPVSLTGASRDITDSKRNEQELRANENRLRLAMTAARSGAWESDYQSGIDTWSLELYTLLGLDPNQKPPNIKEYNEMIHPADKQQAVKVIEDALANHQTGFAHEFRFLRSDGKIIWVSSIGNIEYNEDGQPLKGYGINQDITEHMLIEEALEESENRFHHLADNIAQLAWMASDKGKIFWYNQRWFDYTGTTPEEMKHSGWQIVHHSDHKDRVGEKINACFKSGDFWEDTFPILGKDGQYRWFLSRAIPIKDSRGKVMRWFGTNTDVTDQIETENKLRESETRYRELFNSHHTPMLVIDPETGQIINANPAACEFYGWEWKIITQKLIAEINVLPAAQIRKEIAAAYEADSSQLFNFRHRLANGEIRDVDVYSGKIHWDNKGFLFSIVIDVTERKKIEQALQESESRFRRIADTMPSVVWTAGPDGKVDYVNRQYQDFTGNPAYSYNGWFDVPIHPDDRKTTLLRWLNSIITGQDFQMEHRIRRHDGVYRWFLTRGVPVKDGDKITRWYGSATDIHEVKQYQEELQRNNEQLSLLSDEFKRSNEALVEFASIASHDLQEPLRKILAFGDRLNDTYGAQLGEHGQDYIFRILSAADRMRKMIQGLLEYSRVSTKAQPFEPVNLNHVVNDALSDLELLTLQNKGRVIVDKLPVIYGDPLQMRQLMQNLIGNALKYHRQGIPPVINIYMGDPPENGSTGKYLRLIIEDNGIGFDERNLDRIFQPMQRLHSHTQYEGTGIGLAICAKIVSRHNGVITARSQPNNGSLFIIDLPVGGCIRI